MEPHETSRNDLAAAKWKVYMIGRHVAALHPANFQEVQKAGRDKNTLMTSKREEKRKAKIAKKQAIMRRC